MCLCAYKNSNEATTHFLTFFFVYFYHFYFLIYILHCLYHFTLLSKLITLQSIRHYVFCPIVDCPSKFCPNDPSPTSPYRWKFLRPAHRASSTVAISQYILVTVIVFMLWLWKLYIVGVAVDAYAMVRITTTSE